MGILLIAPLLLMPLLPAAAEMTMEMPAPAVAPYAGAFSALKKVEPQFVCMVTDMAYDRGQIPVTVGGKTYYGCCMACKAALENDTAARQAIDPVSGKTVDKAEAVIGIAADSKAYYFESEENLKKFSTGK